MVKIKMGKLIELLNEWYIERYGTNPHFVRFENYGGNDYGYFVGDDKLMVETEVWTKKYGFIEWLVDNSKININKDRDDFEETNLYCDSDFFQLQQHYSVYESLLMTLSIKDDPIKFLSEILKDE